MNNIFPKNWPAERPDVIQLYSLATPNGQKIGIMLEETGLDYEAHLINILEGDQFDEDYKKINPNSKIPSLIDPNGPGGKPIHFMESGAILIYLAEKTGMFLSTDPAERWETIQWLFFQAAHIGPMFGQFGHFFKFAKDKTTDNYSVERYTEETKRLLGVLETRLQDRQWIMGDALTIADMAIVPWLKGLDFYGGADVLELSKFNRVVKYRDEFYARPKVKSGAAVCSI